jgi:peptidoglycan/xylan/chitin deacetylase (PgdA/CDA1 family)
VEKYGFKASEYVITGSVGDTETGYMSLSQIQNLKARGHTIGSHTVSHPFLTQLGTAQIDSELKNSKSYLDSNLGQNTTAFVTPYCDSNATVATVAAKYYQFSRDCGDDYTTPNNYDAYHIQSKGMIRSTSFAEFKAAVDTAVANNWWITFIFHDINNDTTNEYSHSPAQFEQYIKYLKDKGVAVVPSQQAFNEVKGQ